ncbi:transcriptional regulator [Bifidobacterium margollesii]|uniref:Transcriptional regulator n=1 Tax=Bifidobacterium margollesii TaxID=2020964 RepID=A0A2N5JAY1_9BIFI|nr:transcriptional regulator [Bifidobacterium margollesii]
MRLDGLVPMGASDKAGEAITVGIVDNDVLSRKAMKTIIGRVSRGFHVVWDVSTGAEALHRCLYTDKVPDVLLVDMSLADGDGCQICRELRRRSESIGLLAVTSYDPRVYRGRARESGAQGLLTKDALLANIADAIRSVVTGGVYPADSGFMTPRESYAVLNSPEGGSLDVELTSREVEVLRLYAEHHTTPQIARMLGIGEGTVYVYTHRAVGKLHVKNREQAITICKRRNLFNHVL